MFNNCTRFLELKAFVAVENHIATAMCFTSLPQFLSICISCFLTKALSLSLSFYPSFSLFSIFLSISFSFYLSFSLSVYRPDYLSFTTTLSILQFRFSLSLLRFARFLSVSLPAKEKLKLLQCATHLFSIQLYCFFYTHITLQCVYYWSFSFLPGKKLVKLLE